MHYSWNVLDVWRKATPAQLFDGLEWYHNAFAEAMSLDPKNPTRAAGIIAALSPMVKWDRNLEMARFVYANGHANGLGLGGNCRKAEAIFAGNNPLDVLGGDKVRSFFQNIVQHQNPTTVTIDRHAYDIAMGKIHSDNERKINKRTYRELSQAYCDAAVIANVAPAQMQAVTWVVWRSLKGVK